MRGRRRMDESVTPPPLQERPSYTGSSRSIDTPPKHANHGGVEAGDLEEILQDVSLGSPHSGRSRSPVVGKEGPSTERQDGLGLEKSSEAGHVGDEDAGDIALVLSPPLDHGNPPRATRNPGSPPRRSLTPSPSPSPRHSQSYTRSHDSSGDLAQSSRSNRSRSPSSDRYGSTRPPSPPAVFQSPDMIQHTSRMDSPSQSDFYSRKPSLPASVSLAVTAEENRVEEGDSARFESIPLSTTPPPGGPAPLPSSPKTTLNVVPASPQRNKRRSWNGFGLAKSKTTDAENKARKRSSLINGALAVTVSSEERAHSAPMTRNGTALEAHTEAPAAPGPLNGDEKPESPRPRLHAPPAHPHPFPLPTVTSAASPPVPPKALPSISAGAAVPSGGIGVKGISTFEKVVSHTRPSHLPPKPKDEDDVHYHQWEEMMSQARENERERKKVQEQRRAEKEKKLAAVTPKWDALLNDPGFSVSRVKQDQGLREMWFHGVPGYLRGKAWTLAIGNPLAMSKEAYKVYLNRSKKALDSGRFPQRILEEIESDMDRTLPQLKVFTQGTPMRADLREFLCAWIAYRSDDGLGYAPYVSHIAAMLLLSSSPQIAFVQLCNLLSRPCMRAFTTQTRDEINAFYRVFENLQADTFPKIYANCKNLGLKLPEGYFRSILVEQVPFEACCRLWDQILLDGDGYVFRAALAIFGFLEPRLHYPDKEEILSVLEGRNKATLAITEREKERARLKGESFDDELDGKLSVFGLNEDVLFDWLATDGWRESRYERLVNREMPD